MLLPGAWGQGFATEMCARMLQFGFDHTRLNEIKTRTDPKNAALQRVLQKCGLVSEGMRRAYATECFGFGITRDSWVAMNSAKPWPRRGSNPQRSR
jgi:ribosomal-protein-alanine N-acetyltransferase